MYDPDNMNNPLDVNNDMDAERMHPENENSDTVDNEINEATDNTSDELFESSVAPEEDTQPDATEPDAGEANDALADSQSVHAFESNNGADSVMPPFAYAQPNAANANSYYQPRTQQNAYAYPQYANDVPAKKKSKGKAAFLAIACILIVFAVGAFAVVLVGGGNNDAKNGNGLSDVPYVSSVSSADAEEEGLSAAEVYQKVFKSSVSILAYQRSTGELGVLGSGVICQEDSVNKYTYIVTCAHVINDSDYNIKVELWDGSVHTAEVVNYDDTNDIGVVRIRATGLQIAEFGDSDELQPGATVYAIGSPYSSKFAGTFTRGMVSAVNRLVTTQTSYQLCCIQHDAPINHGNSGGALVNAYGQIVGINALKITAEGYEGLGFSVPSATVIKVINAVIETGIAPKTPKLGISYVQAIYYSQFLSDLIEENNLPSGSIVIADITKDSSLYNTELQVNDIVTAVDGQELTNPDLLVQMIQNSNVGDSFELSVARIIMNDEGTDYIDIQTFTVTATLVEKTDEDNGAAQDDAQEDFYEYFGDDSGNYEDFYEYFYDYFYGGGIPDGNNDVPGEDKHFSIPE